MLWCRCGEVGDIVGSRLVSVGSESVLDVLGVGVGVGGKSGGVRTHAGHRALTYAEVSVCCLLFCLILCTGGAITAF